MLEKQELAEKAKEDGSEKKPSRDQREEEFKKRYE